MDRDAKSLSRLNDQIGHGDVGLRWGWIAGGVIVDQQDRRCVEFKGAFDHLARVNGDVIDGPFGLFFIRDQGVFRVEEKDTELFGFAMGHDRVAVFDERVPA